MTVPNNWYEDFFHGVPLDLWRKAISPEQTKREADFLIKVLQCEVGSHLLDVPCGNEGFRLSLPGGVIARRGWISQGSSLPKGGLVPQL